MYWVCPLIEESEALDLTNATQTHADLAEALQGTVRDDGQPVLIGLLHSRMHVDDKKAVMGAFTAGLMSVLVSTTVIEVGVDVPNASLMVIEHAERFGLSQLHQLRGRVGRGAAASACVLLYSTGDAPRLGEAARERLKAMAETNDGFEIARRDLEIRGPGEFWARARAVRPCCALPIWPKTPRCWTGRAKKPPCCWTTTPHWPKSMCSAGWAPRQNT